MDGHSLSEGGLEGRFIENTSYDGNTHSSTKPKSTSIKERLQQKVAEPLRPRFRTFNTSSDASMDSPNLELSQSVTELSKRNSLSYVAIDQKHAELSPIPTVTSNYGDSS
jgi:hypothetical protein